MAAEEFGIEPVPRPERRGTWRDLFLINIAFTVNPLYYVIGAFAVIAAGLPVVAAVVVLAAGQVIAFGILAVAGETGTDYGLTGQIAMRGFLGVWGARVLSSGYRAVAATYWFAAQALAGAYAIQALVQGMTGTRVTLAGLAVGLAACQALLAVFGLDTLRWMTRIVLPLGVAFIAAMTALYLTTSDPAYKPSTVLHNPGLHVTWLGVATELTVVIGSSLTFLPSIGDFTRYTRSRVDAWLGLIPSVVLATAATVWVGAYGASATGGTNPFSIAPELTGSTALLAFLMLSVIVQSTGVNIINIYGVGLSLLNAIPRIRAPRLAFAIAAVIGVALSSSTGFITRAQDWIIHLGNVAVPLAGFVLADYLVVKRRRIEVDALYTGRGPYRYVGGVNVAGVAAIAAGMVVYYVVPGSWLRWAWGFGVAAGLYLLLAPLQQRAIARTHAGAAAA